MRTRSVAEVAEETGLSTYSLKELVRQRKVSCLRVGTGADRLRRIRFTDEQVAEIFAYLTVDADKEAPAPRRRKRRVS